MDWSGGSVVQFVNSWFVLLGLSAADARLGGDCIGKKARPTGLFEKKKSSRSESCQNQGRWRMNLGAMEKDRTTARQEV